MIISSLFVLSPIVGEVAGWWEDSENKGSVGFFLLSIERAVDEVGDSDAVEGVPGSMKDFDVFVRL